MTRVLAGLGAALIAGGLTRLITASEPWWLGIGIATAVIVWFGQAGVELVSDLLDDLF